MICFVSVNYNSYNELRKLIDNVLRWVDRNYVFIVVDNSEVKNESFREYYKSLPNERFFLLEPSNNIGYSGAGNFALKFVQSELRIEFDWFILSNADIEIYSDIFSQIESYSGDVNNIGAIAPSIISTRSKKDLNPYLTSKPSKLKISFLAILFNSTILSEIYRFASFLNSKYSVVKKFNQPFFIYAGHGSFIILRSEYFRRGKDFYQRSFLFNEEIFIAEKIKSLGMEVIYDPSIRVFHYEHVSTGRGFRSKLINSYHYESLIEVLEII